MPALTQSVSLALFLTLLGSSICSIQSLSVAPLRFAPVDFMRRQQTCGIFCCSLQPVPPPSLYPNVFPLSNPQAGPLSSFLLLLLTAPKTLPLGVFAWRLSWRLLGFYDIGAVAAAAAAPSSSPLCYRPACVRVCACVSALTKLNFNFSLCSCGKVASSLKSGAKIKKKHGKERNGKKYLERDNHYALYQISLKVCPVGGNLIKFTKVLLKFEK